MIVSRENWTEVLSELLKPGIYALDTETTGLSESDRLFSIVIYNGKQGYYFNFQTYGVEVPIGWVLPRFWLDNFEQVFRNPDATWFIHNAKFDMRMLAYEGLFIDGKVICTQASERIYRNNYFGGKPYSLASCAKRRGWAKDDKVEAYIAEHQLWTVVPILGKKDPDKRKHYEKVPLDIISEYALMDAKLCYDIGIDQALKIEQMDIDKGPAVQNIANIYVNEAKLTKTCFFMERYGVQIDREYTQRAAEYEQSEVVRLHDQFHGMTGLHFIDGETVLAPAFAAVGEEIPYTPKGNPSFAGDVLEGMDSPLAKVVKDIRTHTKYLNTYYSTFLHLADKDNTIHPSMWQGGTETGRFSYSDPNLQNVPKEDEDWDQRPYLVRKCFVPREGFVFVSMDYKAQEFRMMLDYAGQKSLIQAVNDGADVHQATADMLGVTRNTAKTINYGLLYGMGVKKLGKALGVSEKEAKDLKSNYFDKLPGIQRFLFQCADKARAQGYVTNWLGRRCYLSDNNFAYKMPNHIIQGGCADIIKLAMNKIDKYLCCEAGPLSRMLLQVHDELLFEMSPVQFYHIEKIKEIMENTYISKNGIKMEVDISHSTVSWGFKDKVAGVPTA